MKRWTSIVVTTLSMLALGAAGITRAAGTNHAATPAPTSPATYTVTAGFGDRGGTANVFAPRVVEIYTGDTVAWAVFCWAPAPASLA